MSAPLLRSFWFWIAIILILVGIALTAALNALHWLIGSLVVAVLLIAIVFLVAAYAVGKASPPPPISPLSPVSPSERIPVIYDCDITMGRPFRDVGDGLVLLYLLGEPRVDLLSVTTTYGNGPVALTARVARGLLNRLGLEEDLPVLRGAAGPDEDPESSRAALHLKDTVGARPGEIVLIATGSMTNLKHAAAMDADFFKKLRALYLLGGMVKPVFWNGRQLAELNFSLDPEAAYQAIHADCPVTLATGRAGLTAVFRGPQFAALQALDDTVSKLLVREIRSWFALTRLWFGDDGFGMWDSIAALPLTHEELFEYEQVYVTSTHDELRAGRLFVDPSRYGPIRLVRGVRDFEGFVRTHFAAWHRLGRRLEAASDQSRTGSA